MKYVTQIMKNILEKYLTTNMKEKELIFIKMGIVMKVIGKMELKMGMEISIIKSKENFILESGNLIKKKDLENIFIPKEKNI